MLRLQNTTVEINGYTYLLTDFLGHGGQGKKVFSFSFILQEEFGLISTSISGAVYSAIVMETGEKYAVKLLIWEQSLLTTERLNHRGVRAFSNEVNKMLELQERSEHIVKLFDYHMETSEAFG